MSTKADPGTIGIVFVMPGNGPTCFASGGRDFGEGKWLKIPGIGAGRFGITIFPGDGFGGNIPHQGGTFAHFGNGLL